MTEDTPPSVPEPSSAPEPSFNPGPSHEPPPPQQRKKQPRQQLSKGMEHLRGLVTDPSEPANSGLDEDAYGVPASFQPVRRPAATTTTESSEANPQKRSDPFAFGTRYLAEGDDVFAFNAWDHVEVDPSYTEFIAEQTALQRASPVGEFDAKRFNDRPEKWWDKFYGNNRANFFKDRKWLGQEFPLLREVTAEGYGDVTVLEVGAGAGNTAFPIVGMNRNRGLRVHACDYSKKAVEVMRESDLFDAGVMRADVWDLAAEEGEGDAPPGLGEGSVDVVIMIFVFSALAPKQWDRGLRNVWRLLKPGGHVLFRDYGRGDLAQVRFKKGRYLEENFYVRGDGTRVYFFEKEELEQIWSGKTTTSTETDGAEVDGIADQLRSTGLENTPRFEVLNLGVDRRMLVNRQRRLKMYRCWMQGLFRKPVDEPSAG